MNPYYNGPFIWPTIEENGVTRPRKYSELTPADAIQADCDVKATNIILQGLPPEVYELVSNHRIAKELWDRIQLLMQGTSLTKQERKYSLLLNDMNIYNVKLEQFQVNTKFLNTLPPEWSKFVTDVKLVQNLHTTNIDQLHAYLGQHEFHANEVRLMHECNSDPLALGKDTCPNSALNQRERDDSWFKDKVLLVQAQANGQILHEEELAFLADLGIAEDAPQSVIPSSEQSNVVNQLETEITSDSNIIPYSQYVTESQQAAINLDNKSVNDTLTAELERYKEQVKVLKEGQNVDLKSKDNIPNKVEVSKELPKVSMVNTSLKKLKHHLASFDVVVKERTTATAITKGICNGCMLSDNHDCVFFDFINDVNARAKSKSVKKSSKRKVWKPTGKVFTNIRYTWRPTGRTFTIVGNACPLTRITTTAEVPLRKPTALESDTLKPVVTLVYSRKPRKSKTNVPVSKPKIIKSISANNKEPNKS
ncbi:hypothetical protein Tco_0359414 [Tanacetum coccineum]